MGSVCTYVLVWEAWRRHQCKKYVWSGGQKKSDTFSINACHPCAGNHANLLCIDPILTDVHFWGPVYMHRWLTRQGPLVGVGSGSECGSKLLLLLCGFFASSAQDDRVNVKKARSLSNWPCFWQSCVRRIILSCFHTNEYRNCSFQKSLVALFLYNVLSANMFWGNHAICNHYYGWVFFLT